jgi:predicted phosphodiesterase
LISLGDRRIAVTHGDSNHELRRLVALAPDYLLSGHSHRLTDIRAGGIRYINPGALHRATDWTVALLDLARDQLQVLPIHNTKMEA